MKQIQTTKVKLHLQTNTHKFYLKFCFKQTAQNCLNYFVVITLFPKNICLGQ